MLLISSAIAAASAPPTSAQQAQVPPDTTLAMLQTEGLENSQLMETLSWLTDVSGGRLTNSPYATSTTDIAVDVAVIDGSDADPCGHWVPIRRTVRMALWSRRGAGPLRIQGLRARSFCRPGLGNERKPELRSPRGVLQSSMNVGGAIRAPTVRVGLQPDIVKVASTVLCWTGIRP